MSFQVHLVDNFDQLLRQIIRPSEGLEDLPYAVNAGRPTGDHTITIGYGYTMVQRGKNGWTRGPNLTSDLAAIGITLTTAMENEINNVITCLNNGNNLEADSAVSRFSSLWSQNFGSITQDQADILFGKAASTKITEIKYRFKNILGSEKGTQLFQSLINTREMAALVSRAYLGITTIRPELVRALSNGDRAEAWFVMRYKLAGTSVDNLEGWAARHYVESQIFGLYDNPAQVTLQEAVSVLQMFQRHRETIYDHETLYGEKFDFSNGYRNLISEDNSATSRYRTLLNSYGNVSTINEALSASREALFSDLVQRYPHLLNRLVADDATCRSTSI